MPDLTAQMAFLLTCDRLREVTRTTFLHSGARAENSAEHSGHLALMALTLGQVRAQRHADRTGGTAAARA